MGNPRFADGKAIAVSIAQVISVINQMEADGVVARIVERLARDFGAELRAG